MDRLGRLERVDLRHVWQREAGDFTPWLAREENLALLSNQIGLDLELEGTERNVGPFRADILCKDTVTNTWILIENQLEQTDHTHLGQVLTYATGLDAVTVIWIAEKFRDEHRATLDWLNEVTNSDINFFGIEIELWRIGDSKIAPKFNIVSKPNDWTKIITSARQNADNQLSATQQLQLEYWESFKQYLELNQSFINSRTARPQHYVYFAIGNSNFRLYTSINIQKKESSVGLSLISDNAKQHFHYLLDQKEEIENELNLPLTWRELPDNKFSDIAIYKSNFDPLKRDDWENQHAWLKYCLEAFHRTFSKRIRTLRTP